MKFCIILQAMFPVPDSFNPQLAEHISYKKGVKMLEQINKILENTGCPTNKLLLVSTLLSIIILTGALLAGTGTGITVIGTVVPFILSFSVMVHRELQRRSGLFRFTQGFNFNKNGVFIAFGGKIVGRWKEEEEHDSSFQYSYLHVFIKYRDKEIWCNKNKNMVDSPTTEDMHPRLITPAESKAPALRKVPSGVIFEAPATSETSSSRLVTKDAPDIQLGKAPMIIASLLQAPEGFAFISVPTNSTNVIHQETNFRSRSALRFNESGKE